MAPVISVVISSSSSAHNTLKHDSKRYPPIKSRLPSFQTKPPTLEAATLEASHGFSFIKICLLGKGGFGSVYYAKTIPTINQNINLPSEIAVKSAFMRHSSSLKHEKRVLYDLRACPFVVHCYGDKVTRTTSGMIVYNLLLEYCSGLSLRSQINSRLAECDVKNYSRDILLGLRYIHCRGYIHCDIKPDNILLVPGRGDRKGTFITKIADFGLAMRVDEKCHNLRGTYRYMSPELVRNKKIDYATDIWAFGCTVLEMLTAKPAWEYSCVEDLKRVIGYTDLMPKIPTNVSEDAKDFLSRCLDRRAAYRQSADMLLEHRFLAVN